MPAVSTITLADPALEAQKQEKQEKTQKVLKNRCCAADCIRKLMLTDGECRCKQRYCGQHRLPETHSCSFDFKAAGLDLLAKQLVRVNGAESRMERI
jgi:predicted nucleic acid binding AN1-type Zn finger protein